MVSRVETPLLERERELERLRRALDAARAGHGGLAVVEGPPGIGKSRLLDALRTSADGVLVVRARAGELERDFPWGVVRQLFEAPVLLTGAEERAALLEGSAANAAEPLGLPGARASAGADAGFAALHGLYWLTVNLSARAPLLVIVDDVHWADAPSARFLAYLARRASELPVLVALARRPAGPESAIDVAAEVPDATLVEPARLSVAGVTALVREALSDDAAEPFCAACHRATGGNPFLVRELLSHLRAEGVVPDAAEASRVEDVGPRAVARALHRRVGAVDAGAAHLARAVAILGTDVELRHAAALAGLELADAAHAADALADVEVLRAERPLEFVHPVVRAAIRDEIPAGVRAELHGRAARLLAADGAGPGRIAVHLLATEPAGDEWVVATLRAAAERAFERGAPDAASGFLSRALAEPPPSEERATLLRELGRAALYAGDPSGADHYRAAVEAAADPAEQAAIGRELGLAHIPVGRYEEAVEALERAADAAARAGDQDLRWLVEADLSTAGRLHPATVARTRARSELIDPSTVQDTPGGRALLCSLAFHSMTMGRAAERSRQLVERGMRQGVPLDPGRSNTPWDGAFMLGCVDEIGAAERMLAAVVAMARERGAVLAFARASAFLSWVALRAGDVVAAEGHARAGLEASGETRWYVGRLTRAWLIDALRERGALDEAHQVLAAAEGEADIEAGLMLDFLLLARARLRLAQRAPEAALADYREWARREGDLLGANPTFVDWRAETAEALLALGREDEARVLAEEACEIARAIGTPRAAGVALRVHGLCRSGRRGLALLEEAVETLTDTPARLEYARALVDLGAALRRGGRRTEAREPLRQALDLAQRCGARALAERAIVELQAAGARPRRLLLSGVESLTASERRVAEMAADGLTNREIAQALFVTMRTVEVHLTHAYQKLAIGSRGELGEALGRQLS